MTEAFKQLVIEAYKKAFGMNDIIEELVEWSHWDGLFEAIRANPALIWDTPPAASSPDAVDIPVTGTESKANALPEGEKWMSDDDVGALIMEYVPDRKVSIESASEVAVGVVELSFHLRDKAQGVIDAKDALVDRKELEVQELVTENNELRDENATLREELEELNNKLDKVTRDGINDCEEKWKYWAELQRLKEELDMAKERVWELEKYEAWVKGPKHPPQINPNHHNNHNQ